MTWNMDNVGIVKKEIVFYSITMGCKKQTDIGLFFI